jgi:hypothetical protein
MVGGELKDSEKDETREGAGFLLVSELFWVVD